MNKHMLTIVFNCLKSAVDQSLNLVFITKDFALKIFSDHSLKIVRETVNSLIRDKSLFKEDLAF